MADRTVTLDDLFAPRPATQLTSLGAFFLLKLFQLKLSTVRKRTPALLDAWVVGCDVLRGNMHGCNGADLELVLFVNTVGVSACRHAEGRRLALLRRRGRCCFVGCYGLMEGRNTHRWARGDGEEGIVDARRR